MAYGILLLRIAVGMTMAGHGVQKLLGWFDGPGLTGTKQMFRSLGFPAAAVMAILAALAETGGLLFAVGLLTPLAALGIAIVMLNAIGAVHWKNGFWNSSGGMEFPLVLLASAVAVAATGLAASPPMESSAGRDRSAVCGGESACSRSQAPCLQRR